MSSPEFIYLVGKSGCTGKVDLPSIYWKLLKRLFLWRNGHQDILTHVIIESNGDLGEISVVILGSEKRRILPLTCYVTDVRLNNFQNSKQDTFPCCHWIGNGDNFSIIANTSKYRELWYFV